MRKPLKTDSTLVRQGLANLQERLKAKSWRAMVVYALLPDILRDIISPLTVTLVVLAVLAVPF
ncbi:MAG: hypothetical protein NVS9B14_12610 [Candidatus Acidiferrum sp.]